MYDKKKLQNWYYNKRSKTNKGAVNITFDSFGGFYNWFAEENKKGCYYCGLKEEEQIKLIELNLVKSKRFFNQNGTRGNRLEIDRKNPDGDYSKENCVLSCYFCNNDKSDIFDENQYKKFSSLGKERVRFLRELISKKRYANNGYK
jgi:hypothetical protein